MRHLSRLFLACTVIAPLAASAAPQTTGNDLKVTATVAASCAVDTAFIDFPAYDPIADNGRTGSGKLTITCTKGHPATIALGNGSNPSATGRRQMSDGAGNLIAYDLFQDSAATKPWGSTVGTDTVAYTGKGKTADSSVVVYGVIGAGQDAAAGNYADTVTITINY